MSAEQGAAHCSAEDEDCREDCDPACWRDYRYDSILLKAQPRLLLNDSPSHNNIALFIPHTDVNAGDDKTLTKEELGKGRQQVSDSRSRLLKLKTERDLDVSALRVTGDERESQRRSKEEEERQV